MAAVVVEQELFRACRVLFGSQVSVSREFLEYLQGPGLKSAFRRRALETHPDVAAGGDEEDVRRCADLFRSVHQAYSELSDYLQARERGFRFPVRPWFDAAGPGYPAGCRRPESQDQRERHQARQRSSSRENWSGSILHEGPLPSIRLPFGHFLYYSGLVSWRMIAQAIVWQRTQRPRLGEILRGFGYLSEEEIRSIVQKSSLAHPFGATARAMSLLTERQLRLGLFKQKRLQPPIGEFFLEKGILSLAELEELLCCQELHNARFADPLSWSTCRSRA